MPLVPAVCGQEGFFFPGEVGSGRQGCSTEQSPLPGIPSAILGKFLPAALAAIR